MAITVRSRAFRLNPGCVFGSLLGKLARGGGISDVSDRAESVGIELSLLLPRTDLRRAGLGLASSAALRRPRRAQEPCVTRPSP